MSLMMMKTNPITPPPELIEEWWGDKPSGTSIARLATQAAQWGADQELEACCEWLAQSTSEPYINALRTARRPKPLSLKEQALAALNVIEDKMLGPTTEEKLIRKALEMLPND